MWLHDINMSAKSMSFPTVNKYIPDKTDHVINSVPYTKFWGPGCLICQWFDSRKFFRSFLKALRGSTAHVRGQNGAAVPTWYSNNDDNDDDEETWWWWRKMMMMIIIYFYNYYYDDYILWWWLLLWWWWWWWWWRRQLRWLYIYIIYIYYIYYIYIYMEKRFVRKMWHPKCTLSPFCPFKLIYIRKFGYEPFWDNLADQYCSSIWIIWIAYINYISTILSLSILYEIYWNMIYLPMISVKSVVEMCYQHCNGPSAIFPWINSCAATWKCTAMLCLWQEADSKIG
jgi:hypothetical protein